MPKTKPWTVSDEFWGKAEPLVPEAPSHAKGGRPRMPERQAFEAMIYVLRTGIYTGIYNGTRCPERWERVPRRMLAFRSGSKRVSLRSSGERGSWNTRRHLSICAWRRAMTRRPSGRRWTHEVMRPTSVLGKSQKIKSTTRARGLDVGWWRNAFVAQALQAAPGALGEEDVELPSVRTTGLRATHLLQTIGFWISS
jgi:transposase